jgi:hypothetical protein
MDEDFVRCYIGNISLITLRAIQKESGKFDEWELMDGTKFDLKKSYGYRSILERDESLLEALAKRSVIAETRQPASIKPSILWNNALNIADVLTLLGLARARYQPTLAVEKHLEPKYSISWGLAKEVVGLSDIVSIDNYGKFISEALTFIEKNPAWLKDSGFIPSMYWYEQAKVSSHTAPSILEMALYWVSLEILAGVHIKSNGLNITNKKARVKRFIFDKGYVGSTWDFLEEVIDDWYLTRNTLFHEGKEPLPIDVLTKRRQQVCDFMSLVLVEMLQQQDKSRTEQIAKQMQGY